MFNVKDHCHHIITLNQEKKKFYFILKSRHQLFFKKTKHSNLALISCKKKALKIELLSHINYINRNILRRTLCVSPMLNVPNQIFSEGRYSFPIDLSF